MGSTCIRMRGSRKIDIIKIVDNVKNEIRADLVCENWHQGRDLKVVLLAFEKYYWRNGSYASLSILLTEGDGIQTADIIGSGGGEGLFNLSWGANEDFALMAKKALKIYGLKEV